MRVRLTNDKRKLLRQVKEDDCDSTSVGDSKPTFMAVNVWERIDGKTVVCYRCFEKMIYGVPSGFCVQSKDAYSLNKDCSPTSEQRQFANRQYLELLCEEAPDVRHGLYKTVGDAIDAFNKDFTSFDGLRGRTRTHRSRRSAT